jgi:hypothetical protein
MEYDNTNRGMLGRNTNKQSDKHPDYSGTININGKDYWLSGWLKEGKNGKFFSLAVKEKETKKPAKTDFQDDDLTDAPF